MKFNAMGTLSGAMATSKASKGIMPFNKTWTPGDTLRVVYPLVWSDDTESWEIIVGAVWGHEVRDTKALKFKNFTRFIPSICEVNPDGSNASEPDLAYKFSQIAPIFTHAAKAREILAIQNRRGLDDTMKQQAIKEIEDKFDTSKNMKAIRPVLAYRDFITTAFCVVYKYTNGKADPSNVNMVSQPLKGPKAQTLIEILSNSKYLPEHVEGEDYDYLEVHYSFPSNPERGLSSKDCKINGLAPEERTAFTDPESWKIIQTRLRDLPKSPQEIIKRTTRSVSETELKQAISSYAILQLDNLDALTPEVNGQDIEALCKHADILHSLNLDHVITNQAILDELAKADAKAAEESAQVADTETAVPNPVPDAPTIENLIQSDAQKEQAVQQIIADTTPEPAPAEAPAEAVVVNTATEPAPAPVNVPNINTLQASANSASGMSLETLEELDLGV